MTSLAHSICSNCNERNVYMSTKIDGDYFMLSKHDYETHLWDLIESLPCCGENCNRRFYICTKPKFYIIIEEER